MGSKDIIIRAVMDMIPDITAIKDATIVKAGKVLLS
jgi:chemotaxis protein histidine kinase CheA